MVWFHKFDVTSTAKIRRSLGIQDPDAERDSRVLYIIVFRKLVPITSLSGDEFLSAWWQVVLCHYTLWMHNVHHRDVSPNNVMVYWYQAGKLSSNSGRLLDDWLKVDAKGCKEKKSAFLLEFRYGDGVDVEEPSPSHQSNWKVAIACLYTIIHAPRATMGENESILQTWLLNNVKSVAPDIIVRHPVRVNVS
ncbi:hypothetical protein DFJ58DRAFT_810468 [Suillus subalutaceus]|uniref:uncharacterized protein n=1 Tax=Suillus subalutaceus TaxID=48586 RepID=UPI001B878020|nr:uncharacterized protein DFJ58DRAFT_810468 [Suillus subalutaceus]KAG1840486.1 hypothetical protein DFJ58DRAFT_810468 [Suillus subalutaceus]